MDSELERLRQANAALAAAIEVERKAAYEARLAAKRARRDIDEMHAAIVEAQRRVSLGMISTFGVPSAIVGRRMVPLDDVSSVAGSPRRNELLPIPDPAYPLVDHRLGKSFNFPIPSEETIRKAKVIAGKAAPRFPSPDDRQAELAAAERAIMEAVPDVSGWDTGSPRVEWHSQWVSARRDYVASGSDADMQSMLAYVTATNPPLARERAPEAHQRATRHQHGLALPTSGSVAKGVSWGVRGVMAIVCVAAIAVILLLLGSLLIHLVP